MRKKLCGAEVPSPEIDWRFIIAREEESP